MITINPYVECDLMKIGIQAWGTDGDIRPLVAIAVELANRNHSVNLDILPFTDRDFTFLYNVKNINIRVIAFPTHKYSEKYCFNNMEIWDKNNTDRQTILASRFDCLKDELRESALHLSTVSDLLLGTQHTLFLNCAAAAKNIPYFSLAYEHTLARSIYAPPIGQENFGITSNIQAWKDHEENTFNIHLEYINEVRRSFGAPLVSSIINEVVNSTLLNIISYSPILFPWVLNDWKDLHITCGYIYADQFVSEWQPSVELDSFIQTEKPPLFICLSNMIAFENNLKNLQDLIIDAVIKSNNRAIFLSNWSHNDAPVNDIFKLTGFVHIPKILPRCALVIHAGGAGFTHDAAKSGTPSIVIPYDFDQMYNAERLKATGICDTYIKRIDLSTAHLSDAITTSLNNPTLTKKAKEIAVLMKNENGAVYASDEIEKKYFSLNMEESK